MNPMGLSAPWADFIEIIYLLPQRKNDRDEPNGI